jgi:SsrA-binding protein
MASNKVNNSNAINIKNRKATFDYEILETFTTGIVLTGTEIKSIRQGKCGLTDTYCMVINSEIWVKNMYIAEYSYGSYNNHTTHRDRKLLLHRKEIRRIAKETMQPGFSIVPLRLFINERGLAKLVIAIGRGKKMYDKRQSIKEREDKRTIDRMFKH